MIRFKFSSPKFSCSALFLYLPLLFSPTHSKSSIAKKLSVKQKRNKQES